MTMKPYLDFNDHFISCHLDDSQHITLTKYDMQQLYHLLHAYYDKGCQLNQGQWNGAVAIMENGWPKLIELNGSYSGSIYRAKSIHESEGVPTLAYALVNSFGIGLEDIPIEDGEIHDCETECCKTAVRHVTTLEDFA